MQARRPRSRIKSLASLLTGRVFEDSEVTSISQLQEIIKNYDGDELDVSTDHNKREDDFTEVEIQAIIEALHRNFKVQTLLLWGNHEVTDSIQKSIETLLTVNPTLTSISLDLTSVSEKCKISIGKLLLDARIKKLDVVHPGDVLQVCDLSRAGLNDDDMPGVCSALSKSTCLNSLSLWGNPNLTNTGALLLKDVLSKLTNLTSMNLDETGLSDIVKEDVLNRLNRTRFDACIRRCRADDVYFDTINLNAVGMGFKELNRLADALKGNKNVTKLSIANNPSLQPEDISTLLSVLPSTRILHVEADWNRFNVGIVSSFRSYLMTVLEQALMQNSRHCTKVDLCELGMKNNEFLKIAESLPGNTTLTMLNVCKNEEISDEIQSSLLNIIKDHPALIRINLTGTGCTRKSITAVTEALKQKEFERLQSDARSGCTCISVRNKDIRDGDFKRILAGLLENHNLRALDIRGLKGVTDVGLQAIRQMLTQAKLPSLSRLYLEGTNSTFHQRNELRKIMFQRALKQAELESAHLTLLDFSGLGLQDTHIKRVCSIISSASKAKSVNISDNPALSDAIADVFVNSVEVNSSITKLHLAKTGFSVPTRSKLLQLTRSRSIAEAIDALSQKSHAVRLLGLKQIAWLEGQDLTDDDVHPLSSAMMHSTDVGYIDLRNNLRLSDRTGKWLLGCVAANPSWHTILLEKTSINSRMQKEIDTGLAKNAVRIASTILYNNIAALTRIDILRGRNLHDEDIKSLCPALVLNHTVQELDLSGNRELTDATVAIIEDVLLRKGSQCSLRKVFLDETLISLKGKQRLEGACEESLKRRSMLQAVKEEPNVKIPTAIFVDKEILDSTMHQIEEELSTLRCTVEDTLLESSVLIEKASSINVGAHPMTTEVMSEIERRLNEIDAQSSKLDLNLLSQENKGRRDKKILPYEVSSRIEEASERVTASSVIGVRLKFGNRSHSSETKNLAADIAKFLGVSPEQIIALPCMSREIQDVNIFDTTSHACHDLAARLYQLAGDPRSEFCRSHNQGSEIFCHYPWATMGRKMEISFKQIKSHEQASLQISRDEMITPKSITSKICHEVIQLFFPGGSYPQNFVQACLEAFENFNKISAYATLGDDISKGDDISNVFDPGLCKLKALKVKELCERKFREVCNDFQWYGDMQDLFAEMKELNEEQASWIDIETSQNTMTQQGRWLQREQKLEDELQRHTRQALELIKSAYGTCQSQVKNFTSKYAQEKDLVSQIRTTGFRKLEDQMSKVDVEILETREAQRKDLQIIQDKLESYMSFNRRIFQLLQEKTLINHTKSKVDEHIDKKIAVIQRKLIMSEIRMVPYDSSTTKKLQNLLEHMNDSIKERVDSANELASTKEQTIVEDLFQGSILAMYALLHSIVCRLHLSLALDQQELDLIASKMADYQALGKLQKLNEVTAIWSRGSHVPSGSVANLGLDEQKRCIQEISLLQSELKAEAEVMWDRMINFTDSVVICQGSESEVLVMIMPRYSRSNSQVSEFTVIPHLRAIEGSFPIKDLTAFSWETLQKYVEAATLKMIDRCASSLQFRRELKQALQELHQSQIIAEKSHQKKKKAQSEMSDGMIAANEKGEIAAEADRKLLTVKQQAQKSSDLLDEAYKALQKAKAAVTQEEKELQQARASLRKVEEELALAKLKVEHLIAQKAQSARIVEEVEDKCKKLTESNATLQGDLKRAEEVALQHRRNAETYSKHAQSLVDNVDMLADAHSAAMRVAELKSHKLEAYRFIAHCAASTIELDIKDMAQSYYIEPESIVLYHHLRLDIESDTSARRKSERQLANSREAIRTSLVHILAQEPSLGMGSEQRLVKRIQVSSVSGLPKNPGAGCEVRLKIEDDPLEPVEILISFLREKCFSYVSELDPPLLHLNRDHNSRIIAMDSTEFLADGPRGPVREGRYGSRRIVTKNRVISGAVSHLTKLRSGTIKSQLASQFGTISALCHPNILPYIGFYIIDNKECAPAIGFVQEYCTTNLAELLAQLHGHDPDIVLDNKELLALYAELDINGDGKVSQAAFVKRLKQTPSLAKKLGISHQALTQEGDIQFVWNYGNAGAKEGFLAQHKFGLIDHDMQKYIDLKKMFAYYGKSDFRDGVIPWAIRLELLLSIVRGMRYLSGRGIIHGRLKSSNIGIGSRAGDWTLRQVTIMDYGEHFVDKVCGLSLCSSGAEKEAWQAPEFISGKAATAEGDIWGFGVIMWEIWTGRLSTSIQVQRDVDEILKERTREAEDEMEDESARLTQSDPPRAYLDVMVQCLSKEKSARPSFTEIMKTLTASKLHWLPEHLPG